jgi:hypothetical protein
MVKFFLWLILLIAVCAWGSWLLPRQSQPPRGSLQSGLSQYPDHPLNKMPTEPISPRFLIEHRSALHGKTVKVRGTVVRVLTSDDAAPSSPGSVTPSPGRFAQPRLFLADSPAKDRDKNYDLVVLLREGDKGYPVGQLVEIKGTVDGNQAAVVVSRSYPDI